MRRVESQRPPRIQNHHLRHNVGRIASVAETLKANLYMQLGKNKTLIRERDKDTLEETN